MKISYQTNYTFTFLGRLQRDLENKDKAVQNCKLKEYLCKYYYGLKYKIEQYEIQ